MPQPDVILPILDATTQQFASQQQPQQVLQKIQQNKPAQILLRTRHLPYELQRYWLSTFCTGYAGLLLVNCDAQHWGNDLLRERLAANSALLHFSEGALSTEFVQNWLAGAPAGASVHSLEAMQKALGLGASWTLISPVKPTASHPGQVPLDVAERTEIVRLAQHGGCLAFALGGVAPSDVLFWQQQGFYGVAGIRSFGMFS